jgi:hypothetical protein
MQPVYEGISQTIKTNADNNDLRKALESLVKKGAKQMEQMSRKFRGANETETCRNIFNYIKNNFTYLADGNEQTIKLPSALLKTKVGDCKSFSLFTASILTNLGISYKFVYTSYNNNPVPGHVYIETGNGCKIDAVYGIFNSEKPPKFKYKKTMNVNTMSGLGGTMCGTCYPKRKMGNTDQGLMGKNISLTVPLAPGRGIFLGMVKANLDGMASKFAKMDQAKLKKQWNRIGGSFEKLTNAIKIGSQKPPKKLGFLGMLRKLLRKKGRLNGVGIGMTEEQKRNLINVLKGGIVAASTLLGTAVATPGVGTGAGGTVGALLMELAPLLLELVLMTSISEESDTINKVTIDNEPDSDGPDGPVIPETVGNDGKKNNGGNGKKDSANTNTILYFAVGAAAIFLLTQKK